jgi:hypothetical protein
MAEEIFKLLKPEMKRRGKMYARIFVFKDDRFNKAVWVTKHEQERALYQYAGIVLV